MRPRPGVVVFDVHETLSDMAPMAARSAEVGAPELAARLWFAVLLRDGFPLAAAGGNEPFAKLAEGALRVVLAGASLNRPADEAAGHVLSGFAGLGVHRDVPEGVRILRRHGLRLVTLTNGSADVADGLLTRAGLRGEFEGPLSVEDAAAWKPVPVAHAHAARACSGEHRADAAGGGASLEYPRRAPGGHAHRVDRQAANTVSRLLRRPRPASPKPRGASRADRFLTRLPAAAAWLRVSATQDRR
jgi:2-haloacid dehalogenase